MKSILISIKPKYVADILNGRKTIEVRKSEGLYKAIQTLISSFGYAEFFAYCTKYQGNHTNRLVKLKNGSWHYIENYEDLEKTLDEINESGFTGKVPFKFRCYKVEEIICRPICGEWESYTKTLGYSEISQASCIGNREIVHYLKGKIGCAIHISDLEIFDKPKELSEFRQPRDSYGKVNWNANEYYYMELTKAPQSWCYVEELL